MEMDDLQNQETWEDITEHLKKRIASVYPAWTDFNVHDPGMVLIELLAWMKDIQLFHMLQISDEHKKKYIKLLGMKKIPLTPSKTYVTVSSEVQILLPEKTKFYAGDICFESDREQAVADNIFAGFVMYEEEKTERVMGDWLKQGKDICIYPFGRESGAGNQCEIILRYPLKSGWTYCLSIEAANYLPEYAVDEDAYDGYGFYPLGEILMEYYTETEWKKADVVEDSTYGFVQDGCIVFHLKDEMSTKEPKLRFTLLRSDYLIAPCFLRISLAWVSVSQKETLGGELEFTGNGFPNQTYDIQGKDLLKHLLSVVVNGELWEMVEDFDCSAPESCHYKLDNGFLKFGDGINGRNPKGRIAVQNCTVCLGDNGNIKAFSIGRTDFELAGTAISVSNERNSRGGRGEETEEDMFFRYNKPENRLKQRAVTFEDYENMVRKIPGLAIAGCKAYENKKGKNQVVLAVNPKTVCGDGVLNSAYIRNIYTYLEEKRLLGTKLLVISPEYIPVRITCEITADVKFRDAKGLVERQIAGWIGEKTFGEGIVYGELYRVIDTLPCVRSVYSLWIEAGSRGKRNTRGDLKLPEHGLLKLLDATCLLLINKDEN